MSDSFVPPAETSVLSSGVQTQLPWAHPTSVLSGPWLLHMCLLDPPFDPHPSVNGATTFSSLCKLAFQGPPFYHPLSSPPCPIQHSKPSWFHLQDAFQIPLFNWSLSLQPQGQPPPQAIESFVLAIGFILLPSCSFFKPQPGGSFQKENLITPSPLLKTL